MVCLDLEEKVVSKFLTEAGCAIVEKYSITKMRLNDSVNTRTAELYAILKAVQKIQTLTSDKYFLVTDFQIAVTSIK